MCFFPSFFFLLHILFEIVTSSTYFSDELKKNDFLTQTVCILGRSKVRKAFELSIYIEYDIVVKWFRFRCMRFSYTYNFLSGFSRLIRISLCMFSVFQYVCRRSIAKRKSVFHAEWNDAFKIVDWMHLLLYIYMCVFIKYKRAWHCTTPSQIDQPTNRMQSEYNPRVAITYSRQTRAFHRLTEMSFRFELENYFASFSLKNVHFRTEKLIVKGLRALLFAAKKKLLLVRLKQGEYPLVIMFCYWNLERRKKT